jgi:hypothetical protein
MTKIEKGPHVQVEYSSSNKGFSMTYDRIKEGLDAEFLSSLVMKLRPFIQDINFVWENDLISMTVHFTENKDDYPVYSPLSHYEVFIRDRLAKEGYDERSAPSNWYFLCDQLEEIARAMYSRGIDISVPQIFISDHSVIEFGNTNSISYSFLEYVSLKAHFEDFVLTGDNHALSFFVGNNNYPVLAFRDVGNEGDVA